MRKTKRKKNYLAKSKRKGRGIGASKISIRRTRATAETSAARALAIAETSPARALAAAERAIAKAEAAAKAEEGRAYFAATGSPSGFVTPEKYRENMEEVLASRARMETARETAENAVEEWKKTVARETADKAVAEDVVATALAVAKRAIAAAETAKVAADRAGASFRAAVRAVAKVEIMERTEMWSPAETAMVKALIASEDRRARRAAKAEKTAEEARETAEKAVAEWKKAIRDANRI